MFFEDKGSSSSEDTKELDAEYYGYLALNVPKPDWFVNLLEKYRRMGSENVLDKVFHPTALKTGISSGYNANVILMPDSLYAVASTTDTVSYEFVYHYYSITNGVTAYHKLNFRSNDVRAYLKAKLDLEDHELA